MPNDAPIPHADLEKRTDAELVALARESLPDGGARAETAGRCMALVYERHRDLVRALCAAKAPRVEVDELESRVWERFVGTCHRRATPMENPGGMLVTMTRRVIASHYARSGPELISWDSVPEPAAADDGYAAAEARDLVDGWLGVLSDRQRAALQHRFDEDLTSAETAALMGTSAGNIDVIVHRAVARLREEAGT